MATKNLIPRASGEGGIGKSDVVWGHAYYDTGDFNKGLFVSGKNIEQVIADTITGGGLGGVWDSGAGGVIYYNGGNVGIGTANPLSKLDVRGDISLDSNGLTNREIYFRNQNTDSVGGKIASDQNLSLWAGDSFGVPSQYLTLKTGGNVGIGTTNPSVRLDVDGVGYFRTPDDGAIILSWAIGDSTSDNQPNIVLRTNETNNQDRIKLNSDGKSFFNSGNVGIGTKDPGGYQPGGNNTYKFDIASANTLFMGCDDATEGSRTANTNKSFRVGGASYQYSSSGTEVAINSLFCLSNNIINRLGIGYGTSGMQAPSEIVFATQAYNTFNQTTNSSGTDTNRRLRIDNSGILIYGLSFSSDVQTNGSGYLTSSSDKRLKNDLGDCEYGLAEVLQVQPKRYTWKDGPEDANPTVGFFAQDVHPIMPEAAPREAIKNEEDEDDYKWGFHSQTIIAALVNATKEQQQIIEDLKSRIETLENK